MPTETLGVRRPEGPWMKTPGYRQLCIRGCGRDALFWPELWCWEIGENMRDRDHAIRTEFHRRRLCVVHRDALTVADLVDDALWERMQQTHLSHPNTRPLDRASLEIHWWELPLT